MALDAPEGLCPRCLIQGSLETVASIQESPPTSKQTILIGANDLMPASAAAEGSRQVHYFGDYALLEEIARGGMGVVYKATQSSLNRTVAVKMILAGQLAGEAEVKRFHAEAEAAANLQHPNIVAIHEVGIHEGQHYFSMDFVDGRNLAAVIRGGTITARRAAELIKTMADAIQYAHQRGILHRDLKPQNVLIDERGEPRITDFGLAKQTTRDSGLTQTGAVMGSPSYMPPEQATGRQDQIAPQSDVYSLGAILYEILTGRPPFNGETALATLRQVVENPPAPPSKLNGEVPRDLETICLKCLEKQPERRYASARALGEDLGRFLNREPIVARPVSAARRMENWLRRHPWTLAGVATLVTATLVGVTYWLWQQNQFLQFKESHPDYVRRSGLLTSQANQLEHWSIFVVIAGIYLSIFYVMKSRRLKWAQAGDSTAIRAASRFPVSAGLRVACIVAGAGLCALGLALLIRTLDAVVWEGWENRSDLLLMMALSSGCLGLKFLWQLAQDREASTYGVPANDSSIKPNNPAPFGARNCAVLLLPGLAVITLGLFLSRAQLHPTLFQFFGGWMVGIGIGCATRIQKRWVRLIFVFLVFVATIVLAETGTLYVLFTGGFIVGFFTGLFSASLALRNVKWPNLPDRKVRPR
jgi:serine/threonine protein kinase